MNLLYSNSVESGNTPEKVKLPDILESALTALPVEQKTKAKSLFPLMLYINTLWKGQSENQNKYAKFFTDFLKSQDFSAAEKNADMFATLENWVKNSASVDASAKRYLIAKIAEVKGNLTTYEQQYSAELMAYMPEVYLLSLKEDIEKSVKSELERLVLINGGKVDLSEIKVSPDSKVYTFVATLKEMPPEAANLNEVKLDIRVNRLFENQKTLMHIDGVKYPRMHNGIKLESDQQYLFLNDLQAFEIKGALANKTRKPVKQEQLSYTYDKEKTEEKIREHLSQKSFTFDYDKSAFEKDKLPLTMQNRDIGELFEQIKLDEKVKTEDGKKFSRQLRLADGTTYKDVPDGEITWDFDDKKVELKPNESKLTKINLFGKEFSITIKNDKQNGIKMEMNAEQSKALSTWMATVWESHIDVLTETDTGDSREYENLKKSEYKRTKDDVHRPWYNTTSTQLSLARGLVVNVTKNEKGKEFIVALSPIEGTSKEKADFQILDAYNRGVTEYFVQRPGHEKTNTVTHVAIENGKLSILEARDKSKFRAYHYLTMREGAAIALWFENNEKSATASTLNILDGRNTTLLDDDLKIKSDPKKGYEFLEKENEVTLKAEHFHKQLQANIRPDAYTALNLTANDVRNIFDTQFSKLYPNGLKKQGILKDGEYYQLDVNKGAKWEATVKAPKESVPANLQELMRNMESYLRASVALRAKKPQYTRLSEGEIKSKIKSGEKIQSSDWTNFISGAWGSDVFTVEGFSQFDVKKKEQKMDLVILDGKNERIIIPFSRTVNGGLKLEQNTIITGGKVYNITYQGNQLYVFPAKDQKKANQGGGSSSNLTTQSGTQNVVSSNIEPLKTQETSNTLIVDVDIKKEEEIKETVVQVGVKIDDLQENIIANTTTKEEKKENPVVLTSSQQEDEVILDNPEKDLDMLPLEPLYDPNIPSLKIIVNKKGKKLQFERDGAGRLSPVLLGISKEEKWNIEKMETLIKALDMKKTVAFLDTYGQKISKNTTMWEFQTVLKENFGESGLRKNNEETFLEFAKYYLELYQKPAPDQDSSTSLKDQYLIYILNVVRTGVDPNERIRK